MPGCPAGVTTTERAPDKGVSEDVGIPGLKPGQAGRPGLPVWTAVPLVSGTGITREPLGLTRPGPRQVAGEQTAGGGDTRPQSAGPHPPGSRLPGIGSETDFKGTSHRSLKATTGPFNYSKSHLGAAC